MIQQLDEGSVGIEFLPQELHENITDFLSPRDFIHYRKALGEERVGAYTGRWIDLQKEFKIYSKKKKL